MKTKLNELPWQADLPLASLRLIWILSALLLLPSFVAAVGVPKNFIPLISTMAALPACIADSTQLGIRKLETKDFFIIPAVYVAIILAAAFPAALWQAFLKSLGTDFAEKQEVLELIKNAAFRDRIYMFLSVCVVTPVIEEVAFRRIIFSWFRKVSKSAIPPILLTSLLFSLAHFFVLGIPGLLVMGIGFQVIYLLRKNLLAAIALHAVVNTVAVTMQFFSIAS